jgi:hypothetical protein
MKKLGLSLAMCTVAILALASLAQAQDEAPGDIARMTYWEAKEGMESEFEEGLKKHNEFHVQQGDEDPLYTWQIVTGKYAGTYARGSFGHHWADLDLPEEYVMADEADSAETLDPYIGSAVPVIYRYLADWSRPGTNKGPAAMSRVVHYHVKNGMSGKFGDAIEKIHKAIGETDWPADYFWYEVVDGGDMPTFVLALPSDDWAGFAPVDPPMGEMLAGVYGEDGVKDIWAAFQSVDEQHSATYVFREDLSYIPAMGDGD